MSYKSALFGVFLFLPLWSCEAPTPEDTVLTRCMKDSECSEEQTCDRGRCVAILVEEATAPPKEPKVKIKSVHPFDIKTTEQAGTLPSEAIDPDAPLASVPITELGIGPARLGMKRSEWFSVPRGEFTPALASDPPGVDARGIANISGARVLSLFKNNILCQISTQSPQTATVLGVRPGDTAEKLEDRYGAISEIEPRQGEKFPGVYFRFLSAQGKEIPSPGPVPKDARIEEIIVGTCRE